MKSSKKSVAGRAVFVMLFGGESGKGNRDLSVRIAAFCSPVVRQI